ncbi:hypothetical protein VOLCADRAFT_95623 [Volvox carteri f. nagariensis]|uniref:AAA+ ATPase domain-containing protein n=1 Tax=Volvox carteri f. nagariensis TaxID=3068 RepID=D8U7T3_VOLCA|nr:uncharacterized protein VOLCADRAFT_95623 [Volvox carteri f. nagariensis]EFJ44200.1 hypothetical protein VOLCADRAFT_95623 [Volvox carteri f. nagariensis]|eukprot:XP_002954794.1 hypothetical protein VOLCADRAFT_95623 [Volvox carteri f. nagariensis]
MAPRRLHLRGPSQPSSPSSSAPATRHPYNNKNNDKVLNLQMQHQQQPRRRDRNRGLQAAAAARPPGADLESLSLAALAAGLWEDSRDGREGLTPAAIVAALDKYIVGQAAAKRALAVALRNRWRRQRVEPATFRDEIMPKNILMVGPTGCGKTEVARRLAKLADAPFVKGEATKYTELGYVGRDVEEIIKDLVEAALVLVRQRAKDRLAEHSSRRAEAIILRALVGQHASSDTLGMFREMYKRGELDDTHVEIDSALLDGSGSSGAGGGSGFGGQLDFGPGGVSCWKAVCATGPGFWRPLPGGAGGRLGVRLLFPSYLALCQVSEARSLLEEAESEKLLSSDQVTREAIRAAEQDGIVFIDEIDKIVDPSSGRVVTGGGVSSEGVQRDLLPIIEGSVVPTKHGNVSTEHVLFICSGAFHTAKPSDMLAELQGRLPIRVELKGLTAEDFYRILTEPQNNMLRQQQELLATEAVQLVFTDGAIRAISTLAEQANRLLDNIGARRLHTVLERVLADISFGAPERVAEARREGRQTYEYVVDEQLVHRKLDDLLKKQDLSRYVLTFLLRIYAASSRRLPHHKVQP